MGCGVAREGVAFEVVVELDLDVHKEGKIKAGAEPGGLVVLDIEVEEVEHGLNGGRTAVVRMFLDGEVADRVKMGATAGATTEDAGCQLSDGHDHGEGSAFDGDEGLVHVDAHGVGGGEERFGGVIAADDAPDDLDQKFLGVASAEVETDSLEDEALEADDDLSRRLEDLAGVSDGIDNEFWDLRTLSSGATGLSGFLTLYAAARISLDFLMVSSTLQATKREASAASW